MSIWNKFISNGGNLSASNNTAGTLAYIGTA